MKRVVIIFICLVIVSFMAILFITSGYNNSYRKTKKAIIKNTEIKEISYLNQYDNYYIVTNKEYLYVIDDKYHELLRIDQILIHDNTNKYDIIYKDGKVMYMADYLKKGKLTYKYYDLYTYELINEVVLGG